MTTADVWLDRRVRAGQLTPCLRTEYQVTIDTELVAGAPGGHRRIPFGSRPVLEVKYRFDVPAWLQSEPEGLVEAPASSKFRWGCAALDRNQDAP